MKKMRVAIYHPNLNLYGGGETVALTIAEALSKVHEVSIFTPYRRDKEKLETFFGLDLSKVKIERMNCILARLIPFPTVKESVRIRTMYQVLEKYDLVIDTCSNGMFDRKLNTKTMCYIHFPNFPRKKKGLKRILNPLLITPENAFCYDKILCNSEFTKSKILKMTDKKIEVLYPPVDIEKISPSKHKKNRIVSIGRFTKDKKHEVMIEAFKRLYEQEKKYSLHLIGSFQKADFYKKRYLDGLKKQAKGYPIEFHLNMPHDEVLRFLEESKIYWHARGYGETDPVEYENFGITTVEAIAAGCYPVVINKGAQPEIIKKAGIGKVWDDIDELADITKSLSQVKLKKKADMITAKTLFVERISGISESTYKI